jgi:hypothetical protein
VLLSRRWGQPEWAAALGMTGLWFILGRGEPFLVATMLLLYLLANDQLVKPGLSNAVEDARSRAERRQQVAA